MTVFEINDALGSIRVSNLDDNLVIHDFENKGDVDNAAVLFQAARKACKEMFPGREVSVAVHVNNDRMLKVMNSLGFVVHSYLMRGIP